MRFRAGREHLGPTRTWWKRTRGGNISDSIRWGLNWWVGLLDVLEKFSQTTCTVDSAQLTGRLIKRVVSGKILAFVSLLWIYGMR